MTTKKTDHAGRASVSTDLLCADGYWCVVCGRYLTADGGVIVHDDLPHPEMNFDDEGKPQ